MAWFWKHNLYLYSNFLFKFEELGPQPHQIHSSHDGTTQLQRPAPAAAVGPEEGGPPLRLHHPGGGHASPCPQAGVGCLQHALQVCLRSCSSVFSVRQCRLFCCSCFSCSVQRGFVFFPLALQVSAGQLRHHLHRHQRGVFARVRLPLGHGLHRETASGKIQRQPYRDRRRQPADVWRGCRL